MKKCFKYIVGGIVFFLIMVLLRFVFSFDIDIVVIVVSTIAYVLLNALCDWIFSRLPKRK